MKLTKRLMSSAPANSSLERKCLKHGVRLTHFRRIILKILEKEKGHLTIEEIYRHGFKADTAISLSAVYCNMKVLVNSGLIERHQFQSSQARFIVASSEPCDHLIDIDSGRVINFNNKKLDKLKAEIAEEYGYSIDDCRVEFYSRPLKK